MRGNMWLSIGREFNWTLTKTWVSSMICYSAKKTKTKHPKPLGRTINAANKSRQQNPWKKIHLLKRGSSSKKTVCYHTERKLSSIFQHFSPPLRLFFPPTWLSFTAVWIPVVSLAQCEVNRSILGLQQRWQTLQCGLVGTRVPPAFTLIKDMDISI